jgi:hypothetical protein
MASAAWRQNEIRMTGSTIAAIGHPVVPVLAPVGPDRHLERQACL